MSACWQHFGEVRELLQGATPDRWRRVAVLMDGHGGKDDAAARAYVRGVIERLPIHERPCRLVVSSAKGGSITELKDAGAAMPGGAAFGRVERFDRYALAPLFGRVGRGDNTTPDIMARPLIQAQVRGIWSLLMGADGVDVSDMDESLLARRAAVITVLKADIKDRLAPVRTALAPDHHSAIEIISGRGMARRLVVTIYEADRATGHGVAGLTLEDARHETANYQRAVRLLGMLRIPVGVGHLYGVGITARGEMIDVSEWMAAPSIIWPLLLGPGQLMSALYAEAQRDGRGYPVPSAERGGATEWMEVTP